MDYLYFLSANQYEQGYTDHAFTLRDPSPELEQIMIVINLIVDKYGPEVVGKLSFIGVVSGDWEAWREEKGEVTITHKDSQQTIHYKIRNFTTCEAFLESLSDFDRQTYELICGGNLKYGDYEQWVADLEGPLFARFKDFFDRHVIVTDITKPKEEEDDRNISPPLKRSSEYLTEHAECFVNVFFSRVMRIDWLPAWINGLLTSNPLCVTYAGIGIDDSVEFMQKVQAAFNTMFDNDELVSVYNCGVNRQGHVELAITLKQPTITPEKNERAWLTSMLSIINARLRNYYDSQQPKAKE